MLAIVLGVAAGAKLASPSETRVALARVVPGPAGVMAFAVPAVEIALAVALLGWRESAVPGTAGAAVLIAFTFVLARAVVRHVPCACFGAPSAAAPAEPRSLVRNAYLVALALLASADARGARAGTWISVAVVLAVVAVALERAARS